MAAIDSSRVLHLRQPEYYRRHNVLRLPRPHDAVAVELDDVCVGKLAVYLVSSNCRLICSSVQLTALLLCVSVPGRGLLRFPAATLLQHVCVKILLKRPRTLLLVVSQSPTTHWFPTLQQCSTSILSIPLEQLELLQLHWDHSLPSPGLLSLAVFVISCPAVSTRLHDICPQPAVSPPFSNL